MKHINLRVIFTYVTRSCEVGSLPKPLPFPPLHILKLHDNYMNESHWLIGEFGKLVYHYKGEFMSEDEPNTHQ